MIPTKHGSHDVPAEFVNETTVTNLAMHLGTADGTNAIYCEVAGCLLVLETFSLRLGDFSYDSADGRGHLVEGLEVSITNPPFASGDHLSNDLAVFARGTLDGETFESGQSQVEHGPAPDATITLSTLNYIRVNGDMHFELTLPDGARDVRGCVGTTARIQPTLWAPWVEGEL